MASCSFNRLCNPAQHRSVSARVSPQQSKRLSRRSNGHLRCSACAMHQTLCVCAEIPSLDLQTRLCLVMHRDEVRKTTNTGRLATQCLVNSCIIVHGREGVVTAEPSQQLRSKPTRKLLLFPSEGAIELTPELATDYQIDLIVPDGTWRQAAKMGKRIPWMKGVQAVTLASAAPTQYRLRQEPKTGGLATMEAIARAFGILEGEEVQRKLEDVFHMMVDRTRFSRGELAREEVRGGVPEGVQMHAPGG